MGSGRRSHSGDRIMRERYEKHRRVCSKHKVVVEAERARFEAKLKGEKPKLQFSSIPAKPPKKTELEFSYGFSDIDIFTNIEWTWDLWVKLPFKVPKKDCEKFKEAIQDAFEKIFLR